MGLRGELLSVLFSLSVWEGVGKSGNFTLNAGINNVDVAGPSHSQHRNCESIRLDFLHNRQNRTILKKSGAWNALLWLFEYVDKFDGIKSGFS